MALLHGRPDWSSEEIYDGVYARNEPIGNSWSSWHEFLQPVKAIIFSAISEGLKFQVSDDGVTPSGDIFVFADTSLAITLRAKYWRAKNMYTDYNGNAFVNGFYQKV